jgi:sugar phosphate isomerase/epimerase
MTSRRTFIQQAAVLTSAALLSPAFLTKEKYKMGLQLYSIRDAMAADLKGTLKTVSGFGYEEVEIYGFKDLKYYGLAPKAFRQLLDDNNLTTSSGHYDLTQFMLPGTDDALKKYIDECMEGAHALNQKYIVWPWTAPEFRSLDNFKVVAEKLNRIGEQLKPANLQTAYHNHDFEFIEYDGKIGYDIILKETDPSLVKIQMDLYWMTRASKLTPHDYFAQYPGRFVSWHIKDMNKSDRDLHEIVGEGSINFKPILEDAKLAGLQHVFVEQGNNYNGNALRCVGKSATYVKRELLK